MLRGINSYKYGHSVIISGMSKKYNIESMLKQHFSQQYNSNTFAYLKSTHIVLKKLNLIGNFEACHLPQCYVTAMIQQHEHSLTKCTLKHSNVKTASPLFHINNVLKLFLKIPLLQLALNRGMVLKCFIFLHSKPYTECS